MSIKSQNLRKDFSWKTWRREWVLINRPKIPQMPYSQVPNKRVWLDKRVGWLFWGNFSNEQAQINSHFFHPTRLFGPTHLWNLLKKTTLLFYLALLTYLAPESTYLYTGRNFFNFLQDSRSDILIIQNVGNFSQFYVFFHEIILFSCKGWIV